MNQYRLISYCLSEILNKLFGLGFFGNISYLQQVLIKHTLWDITKYIYCKYYQHLVPNQINIEINLKNNYD